MAATKPSNKSARFTTTRRDISPGKTAAIAASRERTAAQTAPGTEYKAKRAARKASGGSAVSRSGGGQSAAEKRKKRMAKMKELTAQARELRMKRSAMPTGPR